MDTDLEVIFEQPAKDAKDLPRSILFAANAGGPHETAKETETESDHEQSATDEMDQEPEEGNLAEGGLALEEKIIEKILGVKREGDNEAGRLLYFIKWKTKSYLHASWETQAAMEAMDVNAKTKIRRFLQNPQEGNNVVVPTDDADESLYFNHDYVEPDRILSCDPPTCAHKDAKTEQELQAMLDLTTPAQGALEDEIFYFVKWRRLQYNECTWERAFDLRNKCADIFNFWKRQKLPKEFNYGSTAVSVQDYAKIETSPVFGRPDSGLSLRSYQLEGVNWLMWNWFHKRSCILADEMGLGKTIQTACFLQQLRDNAKLKIRGPHLIIAPLSLIRQWESELNEWCPDINCVVLHGNGDARDVLVHNEFYYQEPFSTQNDIKEAKKKFIYKFDVLLTTYEIVIRDLSLITRVKWKVLVLDEGHRLKNPSSRAFEKLLSIQREFCLLLTGTPLQNKTEELWSLLHFCNSQKFSDLQEFSSKFGDLKGSADVANLHTVLKPYLLRRIKEDVEKSLPPKEETIIEVTLTSIQKKYYRAVYEKNAEFLYRGAKASNGPCLMNVMMELRKCCNHPYLLNGVEERVLEDIHGADSDKKLSNQEIMNKALIESSGKLVLLDKLLPRLLQEGHKVLIFSQMVRALNIIEDFMNIRGYSYERLDGSTRVQDRLTAIDRFGNASLNKFVMLLSTKAGGLGLNLTAADTVIIYDSDWNPQNDLQAQARAHRIGQTKPVVVYRLLTKATYEMQMFHRASLKLGLDRAVLAHTRREAQEGSGSVSDSLQVSEIDELLKKGAYDVFREDDSDIKEFMAADVDAILARSSTTVQYDKNAATSLSGTLGKFSKASFVSADETEDVDINDPDFWWKTMRIENKATNDLLEDTAAYNQVVIGPDGEPKLLRSSLRKRKKTEGWESQASLNDLTKVQKKQFYSELEYIEDDLNGSDYSSSSEDDKARKKEKQKQVRRSASSERRSGDKKRKAAAMMSTLEGKFPGMNSMASYRQHNVPMPPQPPFHAASSQIQKKPRSEERHEPSFVEKSRSKLMSLKRPETAQWNPTARDRCVDLLLRFGFGRWNAIRKRMHAPSRPEVGTHSGLEIESFCRNIVMQCGLSALKNDDVNQGANHTDFIRHAIAAAVRVQESIDRKEQHFEIPAVLLQDSFQKKLSSGRALKALHRMDILNRVIAIISNAIASVRAANPGVYDSSLPADEDQNDAYLNLIPTAVLAKHVRGNSARPPWLHVCEWWDDNCDAHLIIGTFKHGFSAYDEMGIDPKLCFASKMKSAYLMCNPTAGSSKLSSEAVVGPAVSILRLDETKRCRLVIPANRVTEYIGVCSHPGSASWISFVVKDQTNPEKSTQILGYFVEELKAAEAYDAFVRANQSILPNLPLETNFDEKGNRTEFKLKGPVQRPTLPWFHSSVFHGVRSAGTKWQAKIGFEGVLRHVGTFATDVEAAVVHDRFALMHAQHTAVKINFRTARDVVNELQKYSLRGDIEMDFFDVPKSEEDDAEVSAGAGQFSEIANAQDALTAANPPLTAAEVAFAEQVPMPTDVSTPTAGEVPNEVVGDRQNATEERYDAALKPCDETSENFTMGQEKSDLITEQNQQEASEKVAVSITEDSLLASIEPLTVAEIPSAALDTVLGGEPISASEVSLVPPQDAVVVPAIIDSTTVDVVDVQASRGSMPDSRTLNRLLTYLLSVGDAAKSENVAKPVKTAPEGNSRKLLEASIREQATRKRKLDSVFDGNVNKAEMLRALIENGKVQTPSNLQYRRNEREDVLDSGGKLADLNTLTPEVSTVVSWGDVSTRFRNISKKLSVPKSDEVAMSSEDYARREAALRLLGRSKMALKRNEIGILSDTNGAEPMYMIAAHRAGLIKNCEQSVESSRPPKDVINAELKSLDDPTPPSDTPPIREIIDGDSDKVGKESATVVFLSQAERDRLTSFFVMYGAPVLNVDATVADAFAKMVDAHGVLLSVSAPIMCPQIPSACFEAMLRESDESSENVVPSGRHVLCWSRVKAITACSLSVAELRWYFEETWLPFCDVMTRPVPGISVEDEVYKGNIAMPNPFQPVSAHTTGARGLVETFLLHQRVVLTIRFVLWNQFSELCEFLRSDLGSLTAEEAYKSFPVWWCPWVHDIGILIGFLKFGYLATADILEDTELPFTKVRIEAFARKFANGLDVQTNLDTLVDKFPDHKEIEHRVIHILTEVTSRLPDGHFAKLSSVFVQSERPSVERSCTVTISKKRGHITDLKKSTSQSKFAAAQSDFSAAQGRQLQMQYDINAKQQSFKNQQLNQQQMVRQQMAQHLVLQQAAQRQLVQQQQAQQHQMLAAQQYQHQLAHMRGLTPHGMSMMGAQGPLGMGGMPGPGMPGMPGPGMPGMPGPGMPGMGGHGYGMAPGNMHPMNGYMQPHRPYLGDDLIARQHYYQAQQYQPGYSAPRDIPPNSYPHTEAPPVRPPYNAMGGYQYPPSQR